MAYKAIVAKLDSVYAHPNADRLQLAEVLNTQVVVGLNAKMGDIGIYFPADGQLSEEYCIENDLFPRYEEVDGKTVKVGGGMFDPKNRRVRAQSLRSVKSDGFFTSLDSVAYTGVNLEDLYVGYQFDELNGQDICNKYFTPQTQGKASQQSSKKITHPMFHRHMDTKQFHYNIGNIKTGDIVYLTEKVHGTSGITSSVMMSTERKWYKPSTWFTQDEWRVLHGSRRVILGSSQDNGGGFYGTNGFRFKVAEPFEFSLMKGETVYYEIVGYVDENTRIMPPHSTESLKKDAELKALLGGSIPKQIEYNYNCIPGQSNIYVYRITQTNIDGESVDLSWPQVKRRCTQLGIKHVPEYPNDNFFMIEQDTVTGEPDVGGLVDAVLSYEDALSMIDSSHISEGVGVRVEHADGTISFFKAKSYWFRVLEGIVKSDDSYVDIEESS